MHDAGHKTLESLDEVLDSADAKAIGQRQGLPHHYLDDLKSYVVQPVAEIAELARNRTSPLVVGINGCQGSGKSTLVRFISFMLKSGASLAVQVLSLDDFYLTRAQRHQLVKEVHPLLETRGVPGTHDIAMLDSALAAFASGTNEQIALPRFDKAIDDRVEQDLWPVVAGNPDVLLLEGWCVGCPPQLPEQLSEPINLLEATEDRMGTWRRFVNAQLAGPYAKTWDCLDKTLMLQAPGFDCVYQWRAKQESQTTQQAKGLAPKDLKVMDESALRRFIHHYQRLTQHQLDSMPGRVDALWKLSAEQRLVGYRGSLVSHA